MVRINSLYIILSILTSLVLAWVVWGTTNDLYSEKERANALEQKLYSLTGGYLPTHCNIYNGYNMGGTNTPLWSIDFTVSTGTIRDLRTFEGDTMLCE